MAASRRVQARVPGDIQDIANQVIKASGLTVSDVVRLLHSSRVVPAERGNVGCFC